MLAPGVDPPGHCGRISAIGDHRVGRGAWAASNNPRDADVGLYARQHRLVACAADL